MADEFVKGLGIATGAGLVWLVLAGWFRTPSFEDEQLFGEGPEDPDLLVELALILADVMFWVAIIGAIAFWVVLPLSRELYAYLQERQAE
ncbi:MAG: DUF7314 family protein [Halobacteriota archaeon]